MTTMHLVAHAPDAWGHVKPLIALFARIVELRPTSSFKITFLVAAPALPKITRELQLMPDLVSKQITVIAIGAPATHFQPNMNVIAALEALRDGKPLVCQTTKQEHTLPPPTVVLLDPFITPPVPAVRAASGGTCPVILSMPSPMSACLHVMGPEELGGYGDMDARLAKASQAQGKSIMEVADSIFLRTAGKVIQAPGMPAMYDYEYHPQEFTLDLSPAVFLMGLHQKILAADGMAVVSSSAYERESLQIGRKWLSDLGKDLWVIGPLEDVPPAATANVPGGEVPQHTAEDADILGFLDKMKELHGTHSVIYISFGTAHYPKNPEKLHAFIEELLDSRTPFLWSRASPFAKESPELDAKIAASGHGFYAKWVPQRAVLRHAATGWFVSHGGWNSLQETMSLRVPTILWVMFGDQPGNAALLSLTHEAAFELLSVRSGDGARQPLRMEGKELVDFSVAGVRKEARELLKKLKGPEGVRVRANADRLGAELDKSWKEGGEAHGELERFLNRFFVDL